MKSDEKVILQKNNETKTFTKISEVRTFLCVLIPRIRNAIQNKQTIDGWSVKIESDDNIHEQIKEYILYNKILDKARIFRGLDAIALHIKKNIDYVQKLLEDKIENEIYDIDELVS